MADAVTSQTLFDDGGHAVMHFTNISDGTGEAAVTKVDISTLIGAPTDVCVERIAWSTVGMGFNLLWDADTDVVFFTAGNSNSQGEVDFTRGGTGPRPAGLLNNAGAGKTGDIKLTTVGHTLGDAYNVTLWLRVRAT
jgi:hypothetical protein